MLTEEIKASTARRRLTQACSITQFMLMLVPWLPAFLSKASIFSSFLSVQLVLQLIK